MEKRVPRRPSASCTRLIRGKRDIGAGWGGSGVQNVERSMPAPKAGLAILTIMLL